MITHDRWLLDSNRGTHARDRRVVDSSPYDGGWEAFLLGRDQRLLAEERAEANRRNFLRTEVEWLRPATEGADRQAKSPHRPRRWPRCRSMVPAEAGNLEFRVGEQRLGGTILEARQLSVAIGGRALVSDLTFHLTRGSRVGIVGRSGAGKTTLLRTLLGELPPASGENPARQANPDRLPRPDAERPGRNADRRRCGHRRATYGDRG